jgi:Flp pilus assembly protein TadG
VDANPSSGFNFYRLKVINLNGTVEYSAILKFNFTKGAASNWTLYPNPVEGKTSVTYQSFTRKQIWVSIADITGKTISTNAFNIQPGINKLLIDAEKLSAAMYLLRIESDGSIETTSFIKK